MLLTPLEISKMRFPQRLRGYDRTEVESFLETVANDFTVLREECRRLERQLAELKDKLAEFQEMERSLRDAMVMASGTVESAQQRANALLGDAQEKVKAIVGAGEEQRREILADADARRRELLLEVESLERQRGYMLGKLRSLVEDQQALVNAHMAARKGDGGPGAQVLALPQPKSAAAAAAE